MFLRSCGIGAGVILTLGFLAAGLAMADEDRPDTLIVAGKRVPTRVQVPVGGADPNQEESLPRQGEPAAPSDSGAREPTPGKVEARPRLTVRDLRGLEGYQALDNDREAFNRFFRFRQKLLDQGFPADSYYSDYSPYRSFVRDYVRISEYERTRRARDRHRRETETRKVRLLTQHERALVAGLARLERGDAQRAIVALTLAAKLNQGDPACRIHLAQARLAQGHYLEAALALRRALQLQPKLVYADLHLGTYYQDEEALGRYTDRLADWLVENPARAEVHFLLGFLRFQEGDFDSAYVVFERVRTALPEDDLTRDCIEITKPTSVP